MELDETLVSAAKTQLAEQSIPTSVATLWAEGDPILRFDVSDEDHGKYDVISQIDPSRIYYIIERIVKPASRRMPRHKLARGISKVSNCQALRQGYSFAAN
jgi:hypothetical protein